MEDGRLSLMFMVPGSDTVVRINGKAIVTADNDVTGAFERDGKLPCTVTVVTVSEVYFQCAKALMRSGLWQVGDASTKIPTAGEFLQEQAPEFAAASYDEGYLQYAKERLGRRPSLGGPPFPRSRSSSDAYHAQKYKQRWYDEQCGC